MDAVDVADGVWPITHCCIKLVSKRKETSFQIDLLVKEKEITSGI